MGGLGHFAGEDRTIFSKVAKEESLPVGNPATRMAGRGGEI